MHLLWNNTEANDRQKLGLRLIIQLAIQAQYVLSARFESESVLFVARQYDKLQRYFINLVQSIYFLADANYERFRQLLVEQTVQSMVSEFRL